MANRTFASILKKAKKKWFSASQVRGVARKQAWLRASWVSWREIIRRTSITPKSSGFFSSLRGLVSPITSRWVTWWTAWWVSSAPSRAGILWGVFAKAWRAFAAPSLRNLWLWNLWWSSIVNRALKWPTQEDILWFIKKKRWKSFENFDFSFWRGLESITSWFDKTLEIWTAELARAREALTQDIQPWEITPEQAEQWIIWQPWVVSPWSQQDWWISLKQFDAPIPWQEFQDIWTQPQAWPFGAPTDIAPIPSIPWQQGITTPWTPWAPAFPTIPWQEWFAGLDQAIGQQTLAEQQRRTGEFIEDQNFELDKLEKFAEENRLNLQLFRDQAENFDQVESDHEKFIEASKAQISEDGTFDINKVASALRRPPERVQSFARGDFSDEIQFKADVQEEIEEPFLNQLEKMKIMEQRREEDLDLNLERIKQDSAFQITQAREDIRLNEDNNKILWALYGLTFSQRGRQGMVQLQEEWQRQIAQMEQQRSRMIADIMRSKVRLVEDFNRADAEVRESMGNQVNNAKANFITRINAIQDEFGAFSDDSLQRIKVMQRDFVNDLHNIDDKGFERQQANFDRMTDTINLLNKQNELEFQARERVVASFWAWILGMSTWDISSMLESWQIDVATAERLQQELVSWTINWLNDMFQWRWIGSMKANEIRQAILSGETPEDIYNNIVNDPAIKPFIQDQLNQFGDVEAFTWWVPSWVFDWPSWLWTWVSSISTRGQLTTNEASLAQWTDWDVDRQIGDDIKAPVSWVIKHIITQPWTWNIQLQMVDDNGEIITFNHLDPSTIDKFSNLIWKRVEAGQSFAIGGSTGNVQDIKWNWIRKDWVVQPWWQAKLDQWLWSHGDIRIKWKKWNEVRDYLTKQSEKPQFDSTLAKAYITINENPWSKATERLSIELGIPLKQLIREAQAWSFDTLFNSVWIALDSIDILNFDYPWREAAMLSGTAVWTILSPALADFNAQFNYIKNNLTMDKLVALKNAWATFGALSDSERIAIWEAANAIQRDMSEHEFKRQLKIISDIFKKSIGWVDPRPHWFQRWPQIERKIESLGSTARRFGIPFNAGRLREWLQDSTQLLPEEQAQIDSILANF